MLRDSKKSESEGLKDGRETCHDVWFGDGGTNKKTGDTTGGWSLQSRQDCKYISGTV